VDSLLKKSLRVGSIVLLLLSLIFFMGCSNGSTDPEEEDEPGGNGEVVVPPDVEDPKVAKVTILQKDIEVARGESAFFTVDVAADPGVDTTVTWTVLPAEDGEPSILNTRITSKGKLTLDSGLHVGQDIWIQAAAGGVSDTAKITVAPEGPYFTWDPGTYKVAPKAELSVTKTPGGSIISSPLYGYLRGYSQAEKNIDLRVGILQEGVDYSLAYEAGVSGARPTVLGAVTNDAIRVIGTSTPYEGVVVEVDARRITLEDPTLTGIIRITMLPGAFSGSDSGELNPGRTSLVLEVSDYRVLDTLGTLDLVTAPKQGEVAPLTLGTITGVSDVKIKWSHLSYAGKFERQADTPLVATVTLTANDDVFFQKSINAATIRRAFKKGSPEVGNIEVSDNGKTLTFDLTYEVFALVLGSGVVSGQVDVTLNLGEWSSAGAPYGLRDLFTDRGPEHTDPIPVINGIVNDYYEADVKWSGDGVELD
jgi:hypothetical protein